MYLCVCLHVYAHVCACMKVCDQYQMFYPSIHLPFWGCLPRNLELLALSRPSGLWTPEFSCPGLYSALITEVHHPTKIFMWVLRIRIPSWWLWAPRTLMANHLLSSLALLSIATESNKCYPSLDGGIKHHLLSMGVLRWITSWKKMDSSSPSYHQQQVTLQTRVEGWRLMSFFFRLHAGVLTNLIFCRSSSEADATDVGSCV